MFTLSLSKAAIVHSAEQVEVAVKAIADSPAAHHEHNAWRAEFGGYVGGLKQKEVGNHWMFLSLLCVWQAVKLSSELHHIVANCYRKQTFL